MTIPNARGLRSYDSPAMTILGSSRRRAAILLGLALPAAGAAEPAHLVADLAPGSTQGAVELFRPAVELGGSFYLAGFDRTNQGQLWRTDGLPGSLVRLTSLDSGGPLALTTFAGDLWFIGREVTATALWRVPADTGVPERVADVPGMLDLAAAGSRLVFSARDAGHGRELWASDGTAEGTGLLADLAPGPGSSSPGDFFSAGASVFFFASAADGAPVLWRTDGTLDGTVVVAPLPTPPSEGARAYGLGVDNGRLIFTTYSGSGRFLLWRSDGTTAGTIPTAEFVGEPESNPTIPSLGPSTGVAAGGFLYFAANDGIHGRELWRTDGSAAPPQLVADIRPGAAGSSPFLLAAIGDSLLFSASDGSRGTEPWIAGPGGARIVRDIRPGSGGSDPLFAVSAGGVAFFRADDGSFGSELWTTDGTESGTFRVADVAPGAAGSGPIALFSVGEDVLFTADPGGGAELWRTDAIGAAAESVDSLARPAGSFPANLADAGGRLFFATLSRDGLGSYGTLGTSRGTLETTTLVRDVSAIADATLGPPIFLGFGGRLFFRADDGTGIQPWISDGTESGTRPIAGVVPPGHGDAAPVPFGFTPFLGGVVFGVESQSGGARLWKTDGTEEGTALLVDLGSSRIDPLVPFLPLGSELYFAASDDLGPGIWKSDGTAAGTGPIAEFPPGSIGPMVRFGAGFVFAFEDTLWESDGTAAGTRAVFAAPGFIDPFSVAAARGLVFFRAGDSFALWRTDGTPLGTRMLAPSTFEIAATREILLFTRDDGVHGRELWRTDGTSAGTALVRDIRPGPEGGLPIYLSAVGEFVYFSADDGIHGREPWKSDGTESGTRLVQDVDPGSDPSNPTGFTASGGLVYFSADDGAHGFELWAAPLDSSRSGAAVVPAPRPPPAVIPPH
jgi:ELWxxDGT repeat protein